jgi:hypothetical protein
MTGDARRPANRRALAAAIEREEWEVAALCLLLGVARAARTLPPDAVEALLEVLASGPAPRRRARPGSCRGRRR